LHSKHYLTMCSHDLAKCIQGSIQLASSNAALHPHVACSIACYYWKVVCT